MIQFFTWQVFAALCGYIEGVFFHNTDFNKLKAFNKKHKDIHFHFQIFRFSVYILLFHHYGVRQALFFLPIAAFSFSFLHDGVLYEVRKRLMPGLYVKGFFDNPSPFGTAKIKLTFKQRFALFALSFVVWAIFTNYISGSL